MRQKNNPRHPQPKAAKALEYTPSEDDIVRNTRHKDEDVDYDIDDTVEESEEAEENKPLTETKVVSSFQRYQWDKAAKEGILTNEEVAAAKKKNTIRAFTISAVIIIIIAAVSGLILFNLWVTWGNDYTTNERQANDSNVEEYGKIKAQYDKMMENVNADDVEAMKNKLNKLMQFQSTQLNTNAYLYYNAYTHEFLENYLTLTNDVQRELSTTKESLADALKKEVDEITYDKNLFDGDTAAVKDDATLEKSDVYKEQINTIQSKLDTLLECQNTYKIFTAEGVDSLTKAYDDKFNHIKSLYVKALTKETDEKAREDIKKQCEEEYTKKIEEINTAHDSAISEKDAKIASLEKVIEEQNQTIRDKNTRINELAQKSN